MFVGVWWDGGVSGGGYIGLEGRVFWGERPKMVSDFVVREEGSHSREGDTTDVRKVVRLGENDI